MRSSSSAYKKIWLVTFSDLITLLITFYVLFFSLSTTGVKDLKELIGIEHGGGEGPRSIKIYGEKSIFKESGKILDKLEPLKASAVADRIAAFGEGKEVIDAITESAGYMFSVPLDAVFSGGKITQKGKGILVALKEILANYDMELRVRVYMPNPLDAVRFSSRIVEELVKMGVDPRRLGVIGFKGKNIVEFFIIPSGGYYG